MSLHNLTHKHYGLAKAGVGAFSFCESRLPAPFGRIRIAFQPDFDNARSWGVPAFTCADGELLFEKMTHAGNAFHAMSLLRGAYDEMNEAKGTTKAQVAA